MLLKKINFNYTPINIIILLFVLAIYALTSNQIHANEIPYSTNEVDRPLVLSPGLAEFDIIIGEVGWISTDDGFNNMTTKLGFSPIVMNYGITDNLQLRNAGLVYRFLATSKLESVVTGAIDSFVYRSHGGASIDYFLGILTKQRLNKKMAMSYNLYNKYWLNSSLRDEDMLGVSVEGYCVINNTLVFSIGGKYERRDLVNDLHMTDTGLILSIQNNNAFQNIDLRYSVEVTESSEKNNSDNNYTNGIFTLTAKWRWRTI